MTRGQEIKKLREQLEYLKSEHVEDLMKAKREDELRLIIDEGFETGHLEHFENFCVTPLRLKYSEIPKEYVYELALYISCSKTTDCEVFEDYKEFQIMLTKKNEPVASNIAYLMIEFCLCRCSIRDLLCC